MFVTKKINNPGFIDKISKFNHICSPNTMKNVGGVEEERGRGKEEEKEGGKRKKKREETEEKGRRQKKEEEEAEEKRTDSFLS